ncbi:MULTISPECIES: ABC transporter permease [Actinotignum]|uniref:ABC transporter permease n=1 Tax=Actinotignum timonense TaxID=1870995 RepID=A0AAW9HLF4_9ACTO|nr:MULTISPECIES: ABC transporter permease [Actinotignum]MDY5127614.1 ABC transporter permease [Actinotignum sp. SLA_B059]MDY5130012.1 ABC transporter permease [Actinotignum timonense]MDY5140302.1 ABC transporter permease [Actinotignum timonense]
MTNLTNVLKQRRMEVALIVIIVGYSFVVSMINPTFFSLSTVGDILRNGSPMATVAVGVTLIMLAGGIDVSFPAVAITSGYCAVRLSVALALDSLLFIFLVAFVVAVLLELVNAILVHWTKLPTFIITLGTSSVFYGAATTIIGTKPVTLSELPTSLIGFGTWNIWSTEVNGQSVGIPGVVLVPLAAFVAGWLVLSKTTLGLSVYALGNSEECVRRAGISPLSIRLFLYPFMGVLAASMSIVSFANLRFVDPTSLMGTELLVIAAVVIGGTRATGGAGSLLGTFLGVMLIQLLSGTLVFLGIPSAWNNLFIGVIMLIAVCFIYFNEKRSKLRVLDFS